MVHPQGIIHSLVQFEDGSIKAQRSARHETADPIRARVSGAFKEFIPRFDFSRYPPSPSEQPDTETFRNLALAIDAMRKGVTWPVS